MKHNSISNREIIVQLWYHEVCREFRDRLVDVKDKEWFDHLLGDLVIRYFEDWISLEENNSSSNKITHYQRLLFGSYMERDEDLYQPITDDGYLLEEILLNYLEDYNVSVEVRVSLYLFLLIL